MNPDFDCNFIESLAPWWRKTPEAPCLLTPHRGVLTRGWLDHTSAHYGQALRALGCKPGDRVAYQLDKSPEALALFYACLRSGFVAMPLNTAYKQAELDHLLQDGDPRVFIAAQDERPAGLPRDAVLRTLDAQGQGSFADDAARCEATPQIHRCAGDTPACLVYTSGTTGRPKGAIISHGAMHYTASTLARLWAFSSADVLLHALPLFHAHGLMIACNVALLAGAQIIFQPKFDLAATLEQLPQATVFMGVPTFYQRLLEDPRLDAQRCARMRLFTCGSAPLSAEVMRAFAQRTGQVILERYGATETMILCANPLDGERRPGSVGLPLPGVHLRVVNDQAQALPCNEIGALQVQGPGLFSGYWRMPAQTQQEFTPDGWFRTGDLGFVCEDGYVTLTGRSKDLVISGGYNVYPAEVERVLEGLDGIQEAAVVGVPDADFGEAVVAFVIPQDAAQPPDMTHVLQWAKQQLANYKVPKRLHVVPDFPRNVLGKVLKSRLREMAREAGGATGRPGRPT